MVATGEKTEKRTERRKMKERRRRSRRVKEKGETEKSGERSRGNELVISSILKVGLGWVRAEMNLKNSHYFIA